MKRECPQPIVTKQMTYQLDVLMRQAGVTTYQQQQDFFCDVRTPEALMHRAMGAVALRRQGYSLPVIGALLCRPHSTAREILRRAEAGGMIEPGWNRVGWSDRKQTETAQ